MAFRFYRASSAYRSFRGPSAGRTMLQRKCECGTHADGGECEACAAKKRALQRKSNGRQTDEVPSVVYDTLHGVGQPLDLASRTFMESRFDRDFSQVRIHTGAQAESSAQAVNAQAYTVGDDIVFNKGLYAPSSEQGKRLLAHELAHVAQQEGTSPAPGGAIAMSDSAFGEADADRAADAALSGASAMAPSAMGRRLQRQEARSPAPANAPANATAPAAPAAVGPCIEDIVGEEVPSLLQAGAVTIIEFGAPWCSGCEQNKRGLMEICTNLRRQPPSVPVRMYSVNTDDEANAMVIRDYVDRSIPHMYIYVGNTQKVHIAQGLEFDALNALVSEQIDYATTPGWRRGAKSGALWGMIPGAAAGLAGAIAIGAGAGGLTGNMQMLGILGSLAGGVAAGALLGAATGAIVGAATDDRNKGPRQQQRRRLQTKRHNVSSSDPQEREADEWADRVVNSAPRMQASRNALKREQQAVDGGEPLDPATRSTMEARFERDFSNVLVHRDAQAQHLTNRMNAYAVTTGSDIYFAHDAYTPHTQAGQGILGHELAHVAQNESSAPAASVTSLEREADMAGASIAHGRNAHVRHGSRQPMLAITQGQKTAAGIGIGAGALGLAGAAIGLGVAAAMHDHPYGMGALIGGAIGAGVGGLIGGLIGFFGRRTTPESAPETEMLIRRRFGRYLPEGVPAPVAASRVHSVSEAELCDRFQCRHPGGSCRSANGSVLIGWTDTGPAVQPVSGHMPAPLASQSDEPTCHGRQLEHATPQQPVIYYSGRAGTLLHEGVHAHSHPAFGFLHNYVVEGTTEYFARKLMDDINIPNGGSYDAEVEGIAPLLNTVGEDMLARAYFAGEVPALHQAFNARFGRCALITWAFYKEMGSDHAAEALIAAGHDNNYCNSLRIYGASAAALTPGEASYQPPTPPEQPPGDPRP